MHWVLLPSRRVTWWRSLEMIARCTNLNGWTSVRARIKYGFVVKREVNYRKLFLWSWLLKTYINPSFLLWNVQISQKSLRSSKTFLRCTKDIYILRQGNNTNFIITNTWINELFIYFEHYPSNKLDRSNLTNLNTATKSIKKHRKFPKKT